VNFLPLPIVDGGQFLMILYEQIRGRPLPLKAQEMVSIAGLVFLGAMFLLVTFNDVKRLFGM
jgi:regulator of sigma E protease